MNTDRHREAHVVQQEETAATSTLAHVQQFAVASLMAPVFELPLSDVTVVDGEKAVLECRVTATPAAEVTWYVDNVEIRQTDDYQIVFTADGWCRLIIRDVMPGLSTKRAPASVQPTSPFYRQLQGRGRQKR